MLPLAEGAENILSASQQTVWIPTLPHGKLYRLHLDDLCVHPVDLPTDDPCFLWDAAQDKHGVVYIGSWPKGRLLAIQHDNKIIDLGPVFPPEDYIRALTYSLATDKLYLGIGAHAHLLEYDPRTRTSQDILPESFADQQFIFRLGAVDSWLFAQISPCNTTLVFDLHPSPKLVAELPPLECRNIIAHPHHRDRYLLAAGGDLISVTANAWQPTIVAEGVATKSRALALNDDAQAILLVNSHGELIELELSGNQKTRKDLDLPPQPLVLQNVACGPDGRIYTSGYVAGGVGIYDPTLDSTECFFGIDQAESITHDGRHLYFGTYPGAKIMRYTPDEPRGPRNPEELLALNAWHQDRPYALLVDRARDKLFISCVPAYGRLGGALAVLDLRSRKTSIYPDFIPQQSVVSLATDGRLIYGGTSISGGLGVAPTTQSAELVAVDPDTHHIIFRRVIVPEARAITGLVASSTGILYGWAEGTLFAFDPMARSLLWEERIFTETFPADHYWRGVVMKPSLTERDVFFGAAWGTIFRFDVVTETFSILARIAGAEVIAPGRDGKLYAIAGANLYQLATT
jgi:hypothetical protein